MVDGSEERRHLPDGDPAWREDLLVRWDGDGPSGVVWITFDATGTGTYRALVVDTPVGDVGLVASEIASSSAATTEVRTDGLWADWVVAEPFRRVGLDAEAFAVTVDRGLPIGPDSRGDRVPFGFELDVESVAAPEIVDGGYRLDATVTGLLLVGDAELEISAGGRRFHRWGSASTAADVLQVVLDPLLSRFELR